MCVLMTLITGANQSIRAAREPMSFGKSMEAEKKSDAGNKSEPGDQTWILSFPQKDVADFVCRRLDRMCSVSLLRLYLDYRDKELPVTSCNFLCRQVEQRGDMNHV